jgi:hypothetical protein
MGGEGRPARKADLIAICEPIVYKMWVPQHLTARWVSMARYRDSLGILNLHKLLYKQMCSFLIPFYIFSRCSLSAGGTVLFGYLFFYYNKFERSGWQHVIYNSFYQTATVKCTLHYFKTLSHIFLKY